MKHLGDITKIKGAEVPIVDVVTGGSPCQDLSVAGKRAGLAGERSGLFMEQIRIIKEMRENDRKNGRTDEHIRPRYMVWENVPGAFSSNKGEDFRAVLEETAKVAEGDACIPRLEKWPHAGCIMGDGWSLAWRLHDAQFWGVPQRRKRIALVADFGGATAPEILFERKGLSRDTSESGETREGAAAHAERSVEEAIGFTNRGFESGGDSTPKVCYRKTSHAKSKEDGQGWQETEVNDTLNIFDNGESRTPTVIVEVAQPLRAADGGDSTSKVVAFTQNQRNEVRDLGEKAGALAAERGVHQQTYVLEGNGSRPSHKGDGYSESDIMYTLNSTEHHAVAIENHPADSRVKVSDDGMVQTLSSRMGTGGGNVPMVMEEPHNATTGSFMRAGNSEIAETFAARDYEDPQIVCNSVVRRLTPLECERLQGYPDGWTDIGDWVDSKGKKHKGESDSPRYKALGNSIALPFWKWMAKRMRNYLGDNPTMASLFDGIGGFPLSYQEAGVKPVWASEIEEFPIAITKIRFPEENK